MNAQGIVSDIKLDVSRGKQHFTYHELYGMAQEANPGINWYAFDYALKLLVTTHEVYASLPPNSNQFVDAAIFEPRRR